MAAIYAISEPNILGFWKFFSGLMAKLTKQPLVQDYDPNTPLVMLIDILVTIC